ncbi:MULTISPECIES: family 20 glycosylhydrolase [Actinomyces]|uniref:beta-N-acetylhexosaminidase n=1 Tax=Actinomyces respiraculi TaxID=2744574 RepID=A0A7T0LKJ5_9ACTO|nr:MULTISPECIES: family 20 glycosylhydrolase [Actinomyces]QPL05385.1 family 20 glycosylhydrolase [Actinomyces respiraculi]
MVTPPLIPTGSTPARHRWRGLHLDSARTFWPPDVVLELLDVMARYRLNRLHWHLTDDAGWRFAVPDYPLLLTVAAQLPRERFSWYTNVNHDKRRAALDAAPDSSTRGWYRDEDIRRIVAHAKDVGIEIMPEVDLPGHMAAAIRAYPELGDPSLVGVEPDTWPHRNDLLWPGERSEAFLRAVLDHVATLFSFEYVHVGGDECNHSAWRADEALMRTVDGDPLALHRHFMQFARTHLRGLGRRTAVWDEAVDSGLAGDELVFAWRDEQRVLAAAHSGNPWVFAEASYLYLNHLSGPEEDEPAGMREIITARDVLEAPVPDSAVGVQAACWTEFITDRAGLHYHLFPRLLAVAELAWNGPSTSWHTFAPALAHEMKVLHELGIGGRSISMDAYG